MNEPEESDIFQTLGSLEALQCAYTLLEGPLATYSMEMAARYEVMVSQVYEANAHLPPERQVKGLTREKIFSLLELASRSQWFSIYQESKEWSCRESLPSVVGEGSYPLFSSGVPAQVLPVTFAERLRSNPSAVQLFLQVMKTINAQVNRKDARRDVGWKWGHVMKALQDTGLMNEPLSKAAFGDAMHTLFPERNSTTVTRDLGRTRIGVNHESIVSDIKQVLQPVLDVLARNDEK